MSDSPAVDPGDRRPLKSREKKVFHLLSGKLVAMGVTANQISVAGMISGCLAGVFLAWTARDPSWWVWILAGTGIQLRLLSNMIDGMVAIEGGTASPVGELYNEIPDRVSDSATLIGAGYAFGSVPWLGWLAAVLAMLTAYIRAMGKAAGTTQEFCGPMAKPHRMFFMTVTCIVAAISPAWPKFEAGGQIWSFLGLMLIAINVGCVVTCLRRLWKISTRLNAAAMSAAESKAD